MEAPCAPNSLPSARKWPYARLFAVDFSPGAILFALNELAHAGK